MSVHTVTVKVATVVSSDFPAGLVSKSIKLTLGNMPPVVLAGEPYEAAFSEVAAGDYPVVAQAIGPDGADLGPSINDTVKVAPDAAMVVLPSGITYSVA